MLPLITVLSFCTAFLRDVLLARSLGAGPVSDYLWLALLLPAVFESVAGIPLRDAVIARLSDRGRRDISTRLVLVPVIVASVGIALPLWLASAYVVPLLAPGWANGLVASAIPLFSIGLLLLPVHAAYYAQTAIASAKNRFTLAHARSVALNVGAITSCLFWPGEVTTVLSVILVAAIVHGVVLQLHAVAPDSGPALPVASRLGTAANGLALLRSFAFLAVMQQACVLLERIFASELRAGALTCLSVAYRLATIPLAVGVGSMIVPYYVRLEANRDTSPGEFMKVLRPMTQATLWLMFPAAAVMWSCANEITALLFVRGAFSAADGERVATALSMYAWGLPFFSSVLLLGRALFARRLIKAALASALVSMVFYGSMGYFMRTALSIQGLAALMSSAAVVQALCFFVALGFHLGWRAFLTAIKTWGVGRQLALTTALALVLHWCPHRSWLVLAFVGILWGCLYGALTWRSVPFLTAIVNRLSSRPT